MKKNVLKTGTQMLKGVAKKMAERDANTSCPFWSYQPELPESVRKLRKHELRRKRYDG